jgi:sulfoxide reductase heme-binding subunit YedZ
MATAYAALGLLAATLAVGPLRVLRARPNPVSTDLRRDLGIWCALVGLAHTIVGSQVHLRGRWWAYFVFPADQPHRVPVRYDAFGATNYAGLAAALVLLVLLAISNDAALRRLGTRRWKRVQRWTYAVAALVALHGAIYQTLEKRALLGVIALVLVAAAVAAIQLAGYWRARLGGARRVSAALRADA